MTDHQYGPKGHIVEAFINHLRSMTQDDWDKFCAAWEAAGEAAEEAAGKAAWEAAEEAAGEAAWEAAWEIQGADLIRKRNQPFFFLPMFGFADENAVLAALQPKEGHGMTPATELTEADRAAIQEAREKSPAALEAQIASLTGENDRLRFHLKNMVELADEFTPEEPDDYASDLRDIAAARAELGPKENK